MDNTSKIINRTGLLETLTEGVLLGDLRLLDEAKRSLGIIRCKVERNAFHDLTMTVSRLVERVLKEQ